MTTQIIDTLARPIMPLKKIWVTMHPLVQWCIGWTHSPYYFHSITFKGEVGHLPKRQCEYATIYPTLQHVDIIRCMDVNELELYFCVLETSGTNLSKAKMCFVRAFEKEKTWICNEWYLCSQKLWDRHSNNVRPKRYLLTFQEKEGEQGL